MSTSLVHAPRRVLAGLLAGALALTGVAFTAAAANAATCDRIFGENRYETAGEIAMEAFPDGVSDVVLATGENFPDALAASGLAGHIDGPVLLTATASLSPETEAALSELDPDTVHIVGGNAAVSAAVEAELDSLDYDTPRISGPTRYGTAAEIAEEIGADNIAMDTAIIATGTNFPDALAGGPLAYAGPHPILLVNDEVPSVTEAALTDLGISDVIILGGTAAVSDDVEGELADITGDDDIERLSGPSRYETAAEIADYAIANAGFDVSDIYIANGVQNLGVDALSGGPLGGVTMSPILLVTESTIPSGTEDFLMENGDDIGMIHALGGTAVISQSTLDAACTAAEGGAAGSNETLNVTPDDDVTLTRVTPNPDTDNSDDRQYTVSGLTGDSYRVTLVNGDNTETDDDGVVTFTEDGTTGLAAAGTVTADITVVNGTPTATPANQQTVGGIMPVNGTITFTVDGDSANETVVPVVYVDQGASTRLEIGDDGMPTEDFGTGGAIRYVPTEAASGVFAAVLIDDVDKEANQIITAAALYEYDMNDQYFINANADTTADPAEQVTMAEFEAQLSSGDNVSGTYQRNADFQSTFLLDDLAPAAPATVTATADSDTQVTVTFAAVTGADSYNVYRDQIAALPAICSTDLADYTMVGTVGGTVTPREFVDTGLSPSTRYCYTVTAVADGDESPPATPDDATTLAVGDLATPISTDAGVITDAGFQNEVNSGDVFAIGFNRPLTAPDVGDAIRIQDGDGESAEIVNGTNATFTLNAAQQTYMGDTYEAGELLTVTVTAAGVGTVTDRDGNGANNDGVIDYPATITNQSGVTATVGGNQVNWSIAQSTDVTLETGASAPVNTAPADVTAPTVVAGTLAGTSATFTANEPLDPASVVVGDFTETSASATQSITGVNVSPDGMTVTVTLGEVTATGDTVTLAANSVTDSAGNAGPPAAETVTAP